MAESSANFSQFPAKIYEKTLKEILENNFQLKNYEINLSAGSARGDNYLGEIIRIHVRSEVKNFSLILKIPPQNEARRDQMNLTEFFLREILFYDEVLPMFRKFQEEKGIDVDVEGFYEVPYCYKTLSENFFEGVFLEDLKEKNFQVSPRKQTFTKEHLVLVVKALAKKHAISLCLKDQYPEKINKFKSMSEIFVKIYENEGSLSYNWVAAQVQHALETFEKLDESVMKQKALKVLKSNYFSQLEATIDGNSAEPYAVICHGDCWNNNIMFRSDENQNVAEVKLIDYQILRYASPITDLSYSIFACTSKSLRDRHYKEVIEIYYESLTNFITRLGSNPSKIFPREAFEDHLRRFSKYALLMCILVIPSSVSNAEDIPDLNNLSEDFEKSSEKVDKNVLVYISNETKALYEERIVGVFQDMCDLGYI